MEWRAEEETAGDPRVDVWEVFLTRSRHEQGLLQNDATEAMGNEDDRCLCFVLCRYQQRSSRNGI